MASRKQIMAALLAKIAPLGGAFPVSGRRLQNVESVAKVGAPALFLIKPSERYDRKSATLPPVRMMETFAIIYINVGSDQNAIPADVIDDLLDVVDASLAAQLGGDGRQTLGNLVYNCQIGDEIDIVPGDDQGKGTVVIPIHVTLLPNGARS